MPDPVVHHIELCVFSAESTLNRLKAYGFNLYAKKETARCKQLVVRLNTVFFVITEKNHTHHYKPNRETNNFEDETTITRLCCCENSRHEVDTVFNLAFNVKKSDIKNICERVSVNGGEVIQSPSEITDENGTILYSIVKTNFGNVLHTLINKDDYNGLFLPGYVETGDDEENFYDSNICGVDHVTFACYTGHTSRIKDFYEKCFFMKRFEITRNDDETNGLIISDGVGLRLRAMSYWKCSETGLSYNGNFLLVIVESLEGQTNCNVEEFLRQHKKEGIEHIALRTKNIIQSVSKFKNFGVEFRNPPRAYYDELRSLGKISGLGLDLNRLSELGILLDNEDDFADESEREKTKKYLLQIFAKPLFDVKTFFIELIERSGARGLGSGNILALVRSIREEERRNMMKSEAKAQEIPKESFTSPRHC